MTRRTAFKSFAAIAVALFGLKPADAKVVVRAGTPRSNEPIVNMDDWSRNAPEMARLLGEQAANHIDRLTRDAVIAGPSAVLWECARVKSREDPTRKVGIYTPEGTFEVQFKPRRMANVSL